MTDTIKAALEVAKRTLENYPGGWANDVEKCLWDGEKNSALDVVTAALSAPAEQPKPVATVRVTHKGYGMGLITYVAYALPEGLHNLYAAAAPASSKPEVAEHLARLDRSYYNVWSKDKNNRGVVAGNVRVADLVAVIEAYRCDTSKASEPEAAAICDEVAYRCRFRSGAKVCAAEIRKASEAAQEPTHD